MSKDRRTIRATDAESGEELEVTFKKLYTVPHSDLHRLHK